MKTKLLFLVFVALMMLSVSCSEGGDYPKMIESMMIRNQSADTLLLQIPDLKLEDKSDIVKLIPESDYYWQIDKDSYELWMTEVQLLKYFSEMNMWFISQNDTLSVEKIRYTKMTDWVHYLHSDYWFGTVTYFNSHTLIIGN